MEPITRAEHALLAAATAGQECDVRTTSDRTALWVPSVDEATGWGEDRNVRAGYLRHLLIDLHLPVHLRGARIDGDLTVGHGHSLTLSTPACVYTGHVRFVEVSFTGYAGFDGATFTGNAWFDRATFTDDEAQETSPGVLAEIPHLWAAPTVASVGLARWRCAGFGCVRGGRVVGRNRRRV